MARLAKDLSIRLTAIELIFTERREVVVAAFFLATTHGEQTQITSVDPSMVGNTWLQVGDVDTTPTVPILHLQAQAGK